MESRIGLWYCSRSILPTNFDRLRYFLSFNPGSLPLAVAIALIVCSLFSGCQTLEPFSQSMRTRVAAARQWSGNGIAAIQRGAVREARECFAKASSQMPHDHRIVANVARTHFQEGQTKLAIEAMHRAVAINGDDTELLVELGEYYLADGQTDKAQEIVDRSLDQNHRHASGWLLKGKIHAAKREYQKALSDFQKSLGIDSSREDTQLQIVETYRDIGDPLRALSAVEQLLEKYPLDRQPESAILEKSAALVQLGQHSSAIEVLKTAASRSDVSSEIFAALAKSQILSQEKKLAWQTLIEAKSRFPNDDKIAQIMGVIRSDDPPKVASLR